MLQTIGLVLTTPHGLNLIIHWRGCLNGGLLQFQGRDIQL